MRTFRGYSAPYKQPFRAPPRPPWAGMASLRAPRIPARVPLGAQARLPHRRWSKVKGRECSLARKRGCPTAGGRRSRRENALQRASAAAPPQVVSSRPAPALPSGSTIPSASGSQSRRPREPPLRIGPCRHRPRPAPGHPAPVAPAVPIPDRRACLPQSPSTHLSIRCGIRFASGTGARFHRSTLRLDGTAAAHAASSVPATAPPLVPSPRWELSFQSFRICLQTRGLPPIQSMPEWGR